MRKSEILTWKSRFPIAALKTVIVRKQSNDELILIGQTDHSRLVGQLAAHWGNDTFAVPQPYTSMARGNLSRLRLAPL